MNQWSRVSRFIVFALPGLLGASCSKDNVILPEKSLCIAHRGNQETDQENSMASFRSADRHGADGFELDVRNTRDGNAIVFHDERLEKQAKSKPGRSCPLQTKIQELSLAEIRDHCVLNNGEEIPTFREVLREFRSRKLMLFVDLKNVPNDETARALQEEFAGQFDRIRALVIFANHLHEFAQTRRLLPAGIKILLSGNPYYPGSENGFDGVDMMALSDLQIRMLQKKGKIVSLYSINEEPALRHAVEMGVNDLTTDRLSVCQRVQ